MKRVQVLLSTYNGTDYLEPLLDSVLAQDLPGVSVLARDDGSTDGTRELLAERSAGGRLSFHAGGNLGAAGSFFELLRHADPGSDFFAFCDQDDVWLKDKLSRAVSLLGDGSAGPVLYCARQVLVDRSLRRLGLSRLPRRGPAFENALVENIATGCTLVVNAAARALLVRARPSSAVMHDWWAYLTVAAFGRTVYDPEPRVLYRQHGGNVIGTAHGLWRNWGRRVARHVEQRRAVLFEQALEFERVFGSEIDERRRRVLRRFLARRASWVSGLSYALRPDVFRQAPLDDLVLRALIALRRI